MDSGQKHVICPELWEQWKKSERDRKRKKGGGQKTGGKRKRRRRRRRRRTALRKCCWTCVGGVRGLYAGLTPTLVRAFPANACQWLAWELFMRYEDPFSLLHTFCYTFSILICALHPLITINTTSPFSSCSSQVPSLLGTHICQAARESPLRCIDVASRDDASMSLCCAPLHVVLRQRLSGRGYSSHKF